MYWATTVTRCRSVWLAGCTDRDDAIADDIAPSGDSWRSRRSTLSARHISSISSTPAPSTALHKTHSWHFHARRKFTSVFLSAILTADQQLQPFHILTVTLINPAPVSIGPHTQMHAIAACQWINWENRPACWMATTQLCVPSSAKLPAITQAPLDRHSPNKHHLTEARWIQVGSGGQFLSSGWPYYPATRIRPT